MVKKESKKRIHARIFYSQTGLASDLNGRILVRVDAMVHKPRFLCKTRHLSVPAEQYGMFLDEIQTHTRGCYKASRPEYIKRIQKLRALMRSWI
jgi:hypothetical protein